MKKQLKKYQTEGPTTDTTWISKTSGPSTKFLDGFVLPGRRVGIEEKTYLTSVNGENNKAHRDVTRTVYNRKGNVVKSKTKKKEFEISNRTADQYKKSGGATKVKKRSMVKPIKKK